MMFIVYRELLYKFTLVALYFILFSTYFVNPVYAHVLKTDGSIGAVIHIDPEDDPIVGMPANFYFEFKDRENKFKVENCNCVFSVSESGKEIYSMPMSSEVGTFTFSGKGIYVVKVSGSPKVLGDFQSFNLDYDIRVERETEKSPKDVPLSKNHFGGYGNWIIAIGGLVVIAVVFLLLHKGKGKL